MSVKTKALTEKLSQVARAKPVSVQEDAPFREALDAMRRAQTPCLTVCRGSKLSGIFTERDFLMKAVGRARPEDPISRYMTPNPICAKLDQTIGEAVEIMNGKGVRHLPVVDVGGSPASVVTVGAIIQYLAEHFPAAVVNRPPQPHLKAEQTDGA